MLAALLGLGVALALAAPPGAAPREVQAAGGAEAVARYPLEVTAESGTTALERRLPAATEPVKGSDPGTGSETGSESGTGTQKGTEEETATAAPRVREALAPGPPLLTWAPVEDRGFALFGVDYDAPRLGLAELPGRPALVAIGAPWCAPCVAELGELLALAEALAVDLDARFLLVSVDGSGGPAGLALAVEDLFARHSAAGLGDHSPSPPTWAELRADPRWAWADRAALALGDPPGGDATAIPLTLALDRCGDVRVAVQGELDAHARHRVHQVLAAAAAQPLRCDGGQGGTP